MDENRIFENDSYLSGFDSVEPKPKTSEGTFNPTPMFSGMKPQNINSPISDNGNSAPSNEVPATVEPKAETPAPAEPTPSFDTAPAAEAPIPETPAVTDVPVQPEVTNTESSVPVVPVNTTETPAKNEPPVFIPSGTYSYSNDNIFAQNNNSPDPVVNNSAPSSAASNGTYTSPYTTNVFSSSDSNNTPTPPSNNTPSTKNKKPKKYGAGVVILSALLAAIIGAGAGIFGVAFAGKHLGVTDTASTSSKSETNNERPQTITNITVDETVNSSIEAVAKKSGPSIVGIRTTAAVTNFFGGSTEATGEGSGIIYTADGYIITNYHVIESAVESSKSKVEVFLADDTETAIDADIIGYNIASDLAVVKIEKSGLPAIEFADSNTLSVGQYAIAIGNPGGLEFIGSVSYGVISGLNRSVTVGTGNTMSLIQTDAAINPGNSGGALVDITGKLIGVNSVKLVSTGYEGMGFAIPSNTVKEICDNIIDKQNEPTPYIGIQISQSYTSDQLIALGYPAGAVVVSVVEGGPAYESQIQRGDIITEFNGVAINDYNELENAIAQCKPGDSVTVKIFRAGRFYSSHINVAANNSQ